LRRVRLNARKHASRQGWPGIVEQFEGYLYSACRQTRSTAEKATGATLAIKPGSTAPRG